MKIEKMGIKINYQRYGNEKGKTIILLHGWGQNIEMMRPIGDKFIKDFNIIIFDLPGFGNSEEPKKFWSCYDYVECLKEILDEIKVVNPIIVGHSFGGKLGLIYASKYEVEKLVCLASPFCKEVQKVTLKAKMLKTMKKIPVLKNLEEFAKRHMGSTDYRNASGIMREILVGTVNLDITEEVKKIKCPTLLIWGTKDEAVSIERAKQLEKLIPDAGLVIYDECTHYAYLERIGQTINVLKSFFR
ncbi:MAG: alpha/beta hydrolase [Bacilli bacterium]|nr:alpha/beta hydrolase [Bacilli bacterium]